MKCPGCHAALYRKMGMQFWLEQAEDGDAGAGIRIVALIAILGLFLALMGVANLALAADKITVGLTNPTAFDWETFVADDRGFFFAQGLEVSATYMAPDLPIKALLAGSVDLVKCGTHFGIIAAARGAEAKIVGGSIYGYPHDVISQPQFQTLADLRGQKIAGANPASITTVIFRDLMARQGLGPADYSILWIGGSGERFQAVLSGQVAASLAEGPPFNLRAVEGGKKVLVRYGDQVKDLQYTSYFTSPSRSQSRPLVVRYLRAAGLAMRWLNDPRNEREAVQILARRLKIDETLATRSYAYMVTEHRAFRGEGKNDGPGLAEMIRLLADAQLIPRREPWESYVDRSFTTPSP